MIMVGTAVMIMAIGMAAAMGIITVIIGTHIPKLWYRGVLTNG
jgi:hypothetical protein